jgi:hypothetical protein
MKNRNFVYQLEAGESGGGGGTAAAGTEAGAANASAAGADTGGGADTGAKGTGGADDKGKAAAGADAGTGAAGKPEDKGGKTDDKSADKPGAWPANWRETISKGDAKKLERMGRYASPEALADALLAAQERISKGELLPSLKKNATPEEKAAWREAHGIPASADKYELGADAKLDPKFGAVLFEAAHASDQTPDQVKATLNAYNKITQIAAADRAEKDVELQIKGEDTLREEWGPDFRRHINLVHGLLDSSGSQDLKTKLLEGRLSDGTPIGSSPEVLKLLAGLALIQNPSGVVVPGSEADPLKGIEGELEKIQNFRKTNRKAYDKDEKMQARERELIEAQEKVKPRK